MQHCRALVSFTHAADKALRRAHTHIPAQPAQHLVPAHRGHSPRPNPPPSRRKLCSPLLNLHLPFSFIGHQALMNDLERHRPGDAAARARVLEHRDKHGRTLLLVAAAKNHFQIMQQVWPWPDRGVCNAH